MKYSKQRELIKNAVLNSSYHPTAEDIYKVLKKDNPNLSLGTVYRNLNLLSNMGEINKISISNASDRYEKIISEHQHVVCLECGEIFDIELPLNNDITRYVSEKTGVEVSSLDIIVNGICKDCKSKKSF